MDFLRAAGMDKNEILRGLCEDEDGIGLRLGQRPYGRLSYNPSSEDVEFVTTANEFKNLSYLSITAPEISDISALSKLVNLKELQIWLAERSTLETLKDLPALESIDIEQSAGLLDLRTPTGSPKLKSILICHCANLATLEGIEQFRDLRTLVIAGCPNLKDISAIRNAPQLEKIALELQVDDSREIAAIFSLPNLKFINVYHSDVRIARAITKAGELYRQQHPDCEMFCGGAH